MSGGGSGGSSAPSNTSANNTDTVINEVPAYEQQYLTNLLGQASTIAAQPYQQFPGQQVADLTPDQTQAFSNIEGLANNGTYQTADSAATGSALAGANSASNIYGAGAGDVNASTSYNPLAAASPYLTAAANQATPQGIQSYLSPYTNNVVQGLVNTANQNWNNNILPGVNDAFIGNGQFASGRNAQVLGQQANTFEQNLEGSVSNALQSGYTTAGNQAATQAGILGTTGNSLASATGAQATNLQNAGSTLGNLAATQAGAQGAAATNLANTGQSTLNTGITANTALQDVGQQQQQQAQSNINAAMTNWQNQTLWPQQQAGFLSNIIQGLPSAGTSSTGAAQSPATNNQVSATSPLSALGGTILGAAGVTGAKRGGLMHFAEGGQVDIDDEPDVGIQIDAPAPPDNPSPLAAMDTSGLDAMPAPTQSPLPTTSVPSPDVTHDESAPISSAIVKGSRIVADNSDTSDSPLSSAQQPIGDGQIRNYQLLSMARALMQPNRSPAASLGNAFGAAADVGLDAPRFESQQQDVVGKQLGNASAYAGLARQNMINQSLGFPTLPLPNIPGLAGYGQQIQKAMQGNTASGDSQPSQMSSATTTPNGQFTPTGSGQTQEGQTPSGQPMNLMQALQIANGRVPANEQQKYNAVVTLQGAQFPVPPAMAEEAKQYAQDSGKLANAGAIKGAESAATLPYEIQKERSGFQMLRGAGNLPSSLYDPLQGGIVAEGAQQGVVPVGQPGAGMHYRLPPGAVNSPAGSAGQSPSSVPASGSSQSISGLPPGAVQTELAPQQQELLKQGTADMIEKQRPAYEAAQQTLNGSAVIDANLDKLGNTGWFAPGAGAATRVEFAKGINGAMSTAGFSPDKNPGLFFDPAKVGTAEELNKQTVNLGFNLARTMGARESQQVVEQAIKINPGLGTTALGGKMVNSLIAENAQRTKDQYEYKIQALNNGIDPLTAETQFNKQYPGTSYVKRAVSQFTPVQVNDAPWTTKNLLPGTVVQYKKLPPKAIPAPKDYQFSMPPTNKQFEAQQ